MTLVLLIGDHGQGKTRACRRIAESAAAAGVVVGGIVQPAIYYGETCLGYDVVDLASGRSAPLARTDDKGVTQVGRFHFLAEGLAFGQAALDRAVESPPQFAVVDEVGPLELSGGGWRRQVDRLANRAGLTLLSVRRSLADQAASRWGSIVVGLAADQPPIRLDLAQGEDAIVGAAVTLLRG